MYIDDILQGFSEIAMMTLELYQTKYHINKCCMTEYEILKLYKFKAVYNGILMYDTHDDNERDIFINADAMLLIFSNYERIHSWLKVIAVTY